MFRIIITILLISSSLKLYAQDDLIKIALFLSLLNKEKVKLNINCKVGDNYTLLSSSPKLKKGIFYTHESFINNTPNISDSFSVFLDSTIEYNEESHKYDTISNGFTYKILNSKIHKKSAFGFFDGKILYLRVPNNITKKGYFLPAACSGRFPFVEIYVNQPLLNRTPIEKPSKIQNNIKFYRQIFYYNKNGRILEISQQAIGFMIRKEEDLRREFNKEKKIDLEVLKKYLLKMNERYPIQ